MSRASQRACQREAQFRGGDGKEMYERKKASNFGSGLGTSLF